MEELLKAMIYLCIIAVIAVTIVTAYIFYKEYYTVSTILGMVDIAIADTVINLQFIKKYNKECEETTRRKYYEVV